MTLTDNTLKEDWENGKCLMGSLTSGFLTMVTMSTGQTTCRNLQSCAPSVAKDTGFHREGHFKLVSSPPVAFWSSLLHLSYWVAPSGAPDAALLAICCPFLFYLLLSRLVSALANGSFVSLVVLESLKRLQVGNIPPSHNNKVNIWVLS